MPEYRVQLRDPSKEAGNGDVHVAQFAADDDDAAAAEAVAQFGPQGFSVVESVTDIGESPDRSAVVVGPTISPQVAPPSVEERLGDALSSLPADEPITGTDLANVIGILRGTGQ